MIIAIDHGNYAIKTVNHSFIAGVSEHTVKPPIADEILEYDGKYWTLTGNRLSYMRDKTQDERYFNAFMAKSRYTDAVGEVILKLMKAKKKAFIK